MELDSREFPGDLRAIAARILEIGNPGEVARITAVLEAAATELESIPSLQRAVRETQLVANAWKERYNDAIRPTHPLLMRVISYRRHNVSWRWSFRLARWYRDNLPDHGVQDAIGWR